MATTTSTPTRTSTLIKLSLPHVALVLFYFLYLFLGSLIFHAIESEPQRQSLKDVKEAEDKKRIEIQQFFVNYTGSDSDEVLLQELLDELVEIVTHRDWIAGRFDVFESPNPWGIPSAMLFCMTTITTIGYGDLVPGTTGGRIVVILYSCIGVPLSFLLFADIGGLLARLASRIASFIRKRLCRTGKVPSRKSINISNGNVLTAESDQGTDNGVFALEPIEGKNEKCFQQVSRNSSSCPEVKGGNQLRPSITKQQSYLANVSEEDNAGNVPFVVVILLMLTYLCVGAASFSIAEGWNYFEAFYFTFITLTTIGFGDIVPTKHFENNTYFPCLLYTLVGLCYISMCVTLLQARFIKVITSVVNNMHTLVNKCQNLENKSNTV